MIPVLINKETLDSGNAELLLLEIRDYLEAQANV
tara:strand:- start:809 stop:910 length:102 start_codon:yes stop_codon:yes gene_type:complete